jgi:excisionase family DNA binding protein
MLGISRSHTYDLIHRGELIRVRLGRRIIVPILAIDEMLACGSAQAG